MLLSQSDNSKKFRRARKLPHSAVAAVTADAKSQLRVRESGVATVRTGTEAFVGALASHAERLADIRPRSALALPRGRDLDACRSIGDLRELQRHTGTSQPVSAGHSKLADEAARLTGYSLIVHLTSCHCQHPELSEPS